MNSRAVDFYTESKKAQEALVVAAGYPTVVLRPTLAIGESARFVRFLITGGIAAAVNVSARWLLEFAVSYELAVALAYLAGMTTAFFLARIFVFQAGSGRAKRQFARFAIVNVVAFAQVWIISVGLVRFLFPSIGFTWQAETIAHLIGVISPVLTSYIGHKKFSFSS